MIEKPDYNWELLNEIGSVPHEGYYEATERMRVPGGWLYRCTRLDGPERGDGGDCRSSVAVCFVGYGLVEFERARVAEHKALREALQKEAKDGAVLPFAGPHGVDDE